MHRKEERQKETDRKEERERKTERDRQEERKRKKDTKRHTQKKEKERYSRIEIKIETKTEIMKVRDNTLEVQG